ncbi:MAG: CoA-binding protein [Candidatus Methanoliparum thermophilum]|uniref:acetate--CoA ligase (ADP-forming) n=1 Tax=Methanoliparum thermophilum TaxID=2491083 RepID=A0A520KTE8_METT2|nr:acetate--CoA ligase [Candidatus Methanoliparum sp. LAM-1]RZN65264.1 MAG: CoA-binding protein [Candidatus Methanoliparum thermophilum]BDC36559.1 acyl-CoA synthetase [Candidatus Methanoliparum sp. LAM-1]
MLDKFFYPKSITVIGASNKPYKVGKIIIDNLTMSYPGKIYPVNPNEDEINDLKAYKTVLDIPDTVDLAIIVIPNIAVPKIIEECGKKGVKFCIIISSGFKETGVEGAKLEREIAEIAKKYRIRLLGPNCFGVINTDNNLNTTFSPIMPIVGNIAVFSQSGALCSTLLDWAYKERIGFSKFISLGNKVDLNENDFLEYFVNDKQTNIVLGYLEGITDGETFIKEAKRLTKNKALVLIKSGSTSAGARAASSHTGTLAGTEEAYTTAFKKCGAIRAKSIDDWLDIARVFSNQPLPKGDKIAIITNAGGPGIIAADSCEELGISLSDLSSTTIEKLRKKLPSSASIYNPIDVLGDADPSRYSFTLKTVLNDDNVYGCIVILTPQAMSRPFETAREIIKVSETINKPILACFMGGILVESGIKYLEENGVPNYLDPKKATISMASLIKQYYNTLRKEENPIVFEDINKEQVKEILSKNDALSLDFIDCMKILEAYNIPIAKYGISKTADGCIKIANNINYPVALKIVSSDISHKTELGGVRLNVKNDEEVVAVYNEIMTCVKKYNPNAVVNGICVQEMIKTSDKKEVIIGVNKDPQFGHLIMFGMGGIYVEILKDVSFRLSPLTRSDAYDMIHEIKMYPLLRGVRGEKPVDIDKIANVLMRVSSLVSDFKNIVEMDINPLICLEDSCKVVDARITIKR